MNETILPNGRKIFEINNHETKFVYNEIFVDRVYESHGLSLEPGSAIFDIGANIGLFALYAAERFPASKLYCFEPAPLCHAALLENVAPLGERVRVFDVAMGPAVGETEFTYYPNNTIMSGLLVDTDRDRVALISSIQTDYEIKTGRKLEDRMAEILLEDKLDDPITFKCPVRTFSSMMDAENVARVALAKIDVECAENLVLDGIEDRHWPKIDNFIIEVHDLGHNEPQRMRERIASKGFDAELFAAPALAKSGIYEIYARRRQPSAGVADGRATS